LNGIQLGWYFNVCLYSPLKLIDFSSGVVGESGYNAARQGNAEILIGISIAFFG
jgi:hypothetical protein